MSRIYTATVALREQYAVRQTADGHELIDDDGLVIAHFGAYPSNSEVCRSIRAWLDGVSILRGDWTVEPEGGNRR